MLGVEITEKFKLFKITIDDIEFKMMRKGNMCWIKTTPITQQSKPSSLHIFLNGVKHNWNIYDESGRDFHNIYFKGCNINPSFYLKSGKECFRIKFDKSDIKVYNITENHKLNLYLENNCKCNSSQASCWAIAIYNTSSPEESPFDLM
jgi:hypothetical protein